MGAYRGAVDRVVLRKMGVNKFLEDPLHVFFLSALSKDVFANVMLFVSHEVLCNASQKVLASKDDAVVI